jgi:hypothetical protein
VEVTSLHPVLLPSAQPPLSAAATASAVVPTGSSSSTALVERRDELPREVVTMCIEGDLTAFDEKREEKLRYVLALELDLEVKPEQIRIRKGVGQGGGEDRHSPLPPAP